MTDVEKRQVKADTLLDFHESIENLKALQAKARRLSESLDDLARWVRNACSPSQNFEPEQEFSAKDRWVNILKDDARYRDAMDYDETINLARQIVAAQKRVDELRDVKQGLGLN
jgi:hypothetical protein